MNLPAPQPWKPYPVRSSALGGDEPHILLQAF